MSAAGSLPRGYFDAIYAAAEDPWSFAASDYEAEKYATTVALLGERRYARGLEIGCSIGVLTGRLADRCDELLALDTSRAALDRARERNRGRANVRFALASLPEDPLEGAFDLIVLSEVGYYWDARDDARVRDALAAALRPGGRLALVHFLPVVDDYPRTGDAVHEAYLADGRFARLEGVRRERYRADLLARA